ncbi:hypothetical protein N7463_003003 [Penicillium fimorum]|uniref:AA1-like domain-containing protein n=1 Tax=Penicillium fimorum TaxID=1882269 RepID=A0A9W9Y067_9EURO|nr:hypothetical protein N7463_003003 [Penicillium fimorum]
MKTCFVTIAISLASTTFAAPVTESRAYPYSIGDLSLKHTIEGDTWDLTFHLTSRSGTGEALETTTCHTAWINGKLPYEVAAEGPAGAAVTFIESGYKYQCGPYTGPIGNVDTECKTINGGEFYLNQ